MRTSDVLHYDEKYQRLHEEVIMLRAQIRANDTSLQEVVNRCQWATIMVERERDADRKEFEDKELMLHEEIEQLKHQEEAVKQLLERSRRRWHVEKEALIDKIQALKKIIQGDEPPAKETSRYRRK